MEKLDSLLKKIEDRRKDNLSFFEARMIVLETLKLEKQQKIAHELSNIAVSLNNIHTKMK